MRTSLVLAGFALLASPLAAQQPWPARPIHHDIPMTNMIRRAFAAGTRDSTGTPGAALLAAADRLHHQGGLDPATGHVSGREPW